MIPWEKQNIIKSSGEEVPSIEEITNIAETIPDERTRALFSILYLTGGRICEVIRKRGYINKNQSTTEHKWIEERREGNKIKRIYKYNKISDRKMDMSSIKRKQITFEVKKEREVMIVNMRNQKQREDTDRQTKKIPIPLDRPETQALISYLWNYVLKLELEQELFPFGYQYAYKILKPYWNPHWFRHIRATHLTVRYDLSTPYLKRYMGWATENMASRYQELRWGDILDKL